MSIRVIDQPSIRLLSAAEVAAIRGSAIQVVPPRPVTAAPDPICQILRAGHELADALIDTEPELRDIERLGLKLGVALLHAWLKPASCPAVG